MEISGISMGGWKWGLNFIKCFCFMEIIQLKICFFTGKWLFLI